MFNDGQRLLVPPKKPFVLVDTMGVNYGRLTSGIDWSVGGLVGGLVVGRLFLKVFVERT